MKVDILAGGLGTRLSEEISKMFFELEPMKRLAEEGQLSAHFHHGFWQRVHMLRDKRYLEGMWASVRLPGKSGSSHACLCLRMYA